jgi:pyridoxal phosphate enzyme (YggS family)
MPHELRSTELVASLGALRSQISHACQDVGRETSQITLIAVTKGYPASDVVALSALGVNDIGENRDQEAAVKVAQVRALGAGDVRWHFVGRLQRNKVNHVVSYAHAVHSVDRPELAAALAMAARSAERSPLEVFVQLSLDGDPARGGVTAKDLPALADAVVAEERLVLRGLMAVAPLGADADDSFAQLAEVAASLRERHPQADALSAGMSGDFAAAIRHGATHLRVGTALLGRRPPVFG